MAERLAATIPDARLAEIPGAYHHVVLDRPAEVAAALVRFFERPAGEAVRLSSRPPAC
jgi:pimeloyl-ACP methyl ester carboxylesterase